MNLQSEATNPARGGIRFAPTPLIGAAGYSLQRLKTSAPLVPPKPNEFDSA